MAWSISLVNVDPLAFSRLKRLLTGQWVAVTGDLMVIVIGRCCVRGIGSSTPLWHIEAIILFKKMPHQGSTLSSIEHCQNTWVVLHRG